jgi:two-component system LytT family response regulator
MRAVIVEDEPALSFRLKELLRRYCSQVEVVGEALDANEGKRLILSLKPDIVFLDIQMPKKSGFDMLAELGRYDFDVIFVTGHDEYGVRAVKVSALDYLMKPVKGSELRKAVVKAEEKAARHHTQGQVENLLSFIRHSGVTGHKITIPVNKGYLYLNPDEII